MSTTPLDLLELSQELATGPKEAHWRAASSRAYYAAYHVSRIVQKKLPYSAGSRKGTHEQLIADLAQFLGDPRNLQLKVRALGTVLKACRDLRVKADYLLSEDFTELDRDSTIKTAIRIAERSTEIVAMLDSTN